MRDNTIKIISVLLTYLIITLSISSAYALSVNFNPEVDVTRTSDSAKIRWTTDAPADSKVFYDTTENLTLLQSDAAFNKEHEVQLSGLMPNTQYFYKIISKDQNGTSAELNNSNTYYTFQTQPVEVPPAPENETPANATAENLTITFEPANVLVGDYTVNISWTTNTPATTKVEYGNSTSLTEVYSDGNATTNHAASIVPLVPKTKYYYRIKSSAGGHEIVMDNNGSLYSFTTLADNTPPSFNVTIPAISNSRRINIMGMTEPYAIIHAYVDPDPTKVGPVYSDRSTFSNAKGEFLITSLVIPEGGNGTNGIGTRQIVLWAKDLAGNTAQQSYPIVIDTKIPNVSMSIPKVAVQGSARINGTVDEKVSITVYAFPENETVNKTVAQLIGGNATPQQTLAEISGSFNIELPLTEGKNKLIVLVSDPANNTLTYEETVLFYTGPPIFLTPMQGELYTKYSPAYFDEVLVSGQLNRQCTIEIFVNNKTQGNVTTDSKGYFNLTVKLEKTFHFFTGQFTDVSGIPYQYLNASSIPTPTTYQSPNEKQTQTPMGNYAWKNDINLVAVDDAGQKTTFQDSMLYAMCGYGMQWLVDRSNPTPDTLMPSLLLSGNAQVTLNYVLNWTQPNANVTINGVDVQFRELSENDRKDWDLEYAHPSIVPIPSQDYKKGFIQVNLKVDDPTPSGKNWTRFQMEQNVSQHRKSDSIASLIKPVDRGETCRLPGLGCIKIPLVLTIRYTVPSIPGEQIQKQCWFVETAIEPRLLNGSVIPKEFLSGMIAFLNSSITLINDVLEPLKKVQLFVLIGCGATWIIQFFYSVSEMYSCELSSALAGGQWTVNSAGQGKMANLQDSCENDDQCAACMQAQSNTKKFEYYSHWICDRIFCPSAPSLQKYIKDAVAKNPKQDPRFATSDCQMASTRDILKQWVDYDKDTNKEYCENPHKFEKGDPKNCCIYEYNKKWGPACVLMDEARESACLADQNKYYVNSSYGGTEGLKCYPTWNAVAGFCEPQGKVSPEMINVGAFTTAYAKTEQNEYEQFSEVGPCADSYECYGNFCSFNDPQGDIKDNDTANKIKSDSALLKQTCTCKSGSEAKAGGGCDIKHRDTGTLNGQRAFVRVTPLEQSAQADGGYSKWAVELGYVDTTLKTQSLAKSVGEPSTVTQEYSFIPTDDITGTLGDMTSDSPPDQFKAKISEALKDGKKPQFQQETYNKIRDSLGMTGKEYIVDPTSGILRSLQCACIPAIVSWLSFWRSGMVAIKACFESILITGDGSSGICQEVLSVFICDIIYDLISCFVKKYSASAGGRSEGIGKFFAAISGAGTKVQNSVIDRYGSSNIFKALFADRKLVHAICLFAFTGQWIFDVEGILQADFPIPIKSKAFINPSQRRFVSANTVTEPKGLTTWNYNIGVAIIAGSDLTYTVTLICSDDYSCDPTEGFKGGRCDCVDLKKQMASINLPGVPPTMKAGEVLGAGGQGAVFNENRAGPYRYDKVEVSWTYTDKDGKVVTEKSDPIKIRQIGGGPPSYCEFSLTKGAYVCNIELGAEDYARFVQEPRPEKAVFETGDFLAITHEIENTYPESAAAYCSGSMFCAYTRFLKVTVRNQNGNEIYPGPGREPDAIPINTKGRVNIDAPASKLVIQTSNFLQASTQTLTPVSLSVGISVRASATPTAKFGPALFTFKGNKFDVCNVPDDARISGDHIVSGANTQPLTVQGCQPGGDVNAKSSTEYLVRYGNVEFYVTTNQPGSLDGKMAIVRYDPPTTGPVDETKYCPTEPVVWTVTSLLYNAEQMAGSNQFMPSAQSIDRKEIKVQVQCRRTGQQAGKFIPELNSTGTIPLQMAQDGQQIFMINGVNYTIIMQTLDIFRAAGGIYDSSNAMKCQFDLSKTQITTTPGYPNKACTINGAAPDVWVVLDGIDTISTPKNAQIRILNRDPTNMGTQFPGQQIQQPAVGYLAPTEPVSKSDKVNYNLANCDLSSQTKTALQKAVTLLEGNEKFYLSSCSRTVSKQSDLFWQWATGQKAETVCGPTKLVGANRGNITWLNEHKSDIMNPSQYQSCPHVNGVAVDIALQNSAAPDKTMRLKEIMCKAGFVNYNAETWHYEYGDGSYYWKKLRPDTLNPSEVLIGGQLSPLCYYPSTASQPKTNEIQPEPTADDIEQQCIDGYIATNPGPCNCMGARVDDPTSNQWLGSSCCSNTLKQGTCT